MSMTCYAGKIEVKTKSAGSAVFEYEFDNEICPQIVVPNNWKTLCNDRAQVMNFIDCLLWTDGLRELIQEFDECLPFEDLMSGPKYDEFLSRIEESAGQIECITVSVIDEQSNTVFQKETLQA